MTHHESITPINGDAQAQAALSHVKSLAVVADSTMGVPPAVAPSLLAFVRDLQALEGGSRPCVQQHLLRHWDQIVAAQTDKTRRLYLKETPIDHDDWEVLATELEAHNIASPARLEHALVLFEDLPLDLIGPALALTFQDGELLDELRDYLRAHRTRLVTLMAEIL